MKHSVGYRDGSAIMFNGVFLIRQSLFVVETCFVFGGFMKNDDVNKSKMK